MIYTPCAYRALRLRSGHGDLAVAARNQPLVPIALESLPGDWCDRRPPMGDRRIRHILVGQRPVVGDTIKQLHALGYAETFQWNRILPVPENGIVITPEQGETFSFLLRSLPLE